MFEEKQPYVRDMSKFYNPKIEKVSVIVEGKTNQLYAEGMRLFKQYDKICKYFTEGKQRDAKTNQMQKHLWLHDLGVGEYLSDKYALWIDFRMINEKTLQGTDRKVVGKTHLALDLLERERERDRERVPQ